MTPALTRAIDVCSRTLRTEALEALQQGSPQAIAVVLDPPAEAPSVRVVQLLSQAARYRQLQTAVRETGALAVVLVLDGFLAKGGEALLMVAVSRDGTGRAEALPYKRGALGLSFRPIQSSPEILKHYHKQLFAD